MPKPKRVTVVLCVLVCLVPMVAVTVLATLAELGTSEPVTSRDHGRLPVIHDLAPERALTEQPTWLRTRHWDGRMEYEYILRAPDLYMDSRLISAPSEADAHAVFSEERALPRAHDLFDLRSEYRARQLDETSLLADELALHTITRADEPYGAYALTRRGRHVLRVHVEGLHPTDDALLELLDRYLTRLVADDRSAAAG